MKADNKIIIVEPSYLLSSGLAHCFDDSQNLTVTVQLDSVERLHEKLNINNPDILIINPLLLLYSDVISLRQIIHDFPDMICMALVSSYVDRNVLKQYNDVIELNDGKQKVISKIYASLNDSCSNASQTESIELSNRETDVLVAIAKGLTNKEISEQLFISVHTVITHRKNIIKKTGIKSVSGLTVYALLNNLIDESEVNK